MMPDFQVNDCMQSIPGTADDLHLIEVGYLKHLRVGLPEEQASSVVALAASTDPAYIICQELAAPARDHDHQDRDILFSSKLLFQWSRRYGHLH
jgi:hypothetical protein